MDTITRDRRYEECCEDGSISSAVSFAALLGLTFAVIATFANQKYIDSVANELLWVTVYGHILLGTTSLVIISVRAYRQLQRGRTITRPQLDFSLNVEFFFLSIFGLGSVLETLVSSTIDIECWMNTSKLLYLLSTLSRCLKILFILLQLMFLSYFKNSKFVNNFRISFCFIFIVLANLSIWFREVQRSIHYIAFPDNSTAFIVGNKAHSDQHTDDFSCYYHSKILPFYYALLPYLRPTILQFCILSVAFLYRLHPDFKYKSSLTGIRETMLSQGGERRTHPPCKTATLIYGLISNAVMCTEFLIVRILVVDAIATYIWENTVLLHKLILLIAVFVQFHRVSRNVDTFTTIPWKVDGSEYILILSTAGNITYTVLEVLTSQEIYTWVPVKITHNVIDLVVAYYQTILILHSNRIQIKQNVLTVEYVNVSDLFLFIAVGNLSLWLIKSLYGMDTIEKIGYDRNTWADVIGQLLFPALIFNRFISAMGLLCLFNRFRKMYY